MQAQTTPQAHYRRTKSGEWVVMAPVTQLHVGATITVHKRDGSTKTETISKVGKAFECDGVQQAYGYLEPRTSSFPRYSSGSRHIPRCERCRSCGGDGGVEAELGECAACGTDYDC